MDEELPSSKLGTKEYWDDVYTKELDIPNIDEDPGWFGASASKRVLKWILHCQNISKSSSILDIGCGAGFMLAELYERGFTNLIGIDYSTNALKVCQKSFINRGISEDVVSWVCVDIMTETLVCDKIDGCSIPTLYSKYNIKQWPDCDTVPNNFSPCKFDVCLDKGTYDAVSLNPDNSFEKRQSYIRKLTNWMEVDSLFIIVSCNWTTEELIKHFSCLKFMQEIKAQSFSFGGRTGQTVSTCIFIKTQ